MLFNSLDFAIFLPIVFFLYWFIFNRNLRLQNLLLVVSSYVFYGWWDWRFLSLIVFSTVVDYFISIGIKSSTNEKARFKLLWVSIIVNIGLLATFKYYNFFLDNFVKAFLYFGIEFKASSLKVILPVGISFYTFQTLSYTIDVYKRKLAPTKDFIAFAAFVNFFPQLVAGPIERATNLLPQFYQTRTFDYGKAVNGLRQILWGLFKKVVIADNCSVFANEIFNHSDLYGGSTLLLGAFFFTFQIYGDFSGYSDIAIGTSRLFGFDLMRNFNFPYFSRDIAEFWRRWHISLSTWFRDYLYIPLGGSKGGKWLKVRNTFVIFLVSGFWHGANWTFVLWGFLNALFFVPLLLANRNRNNLEIVAVGKLTPNSKEFFSIIGTFMLTVFAWIIFRANNIEHAYTYIKEILSPSLFNMPEIKDLFGFLITIVLLIIFNVIEWYGRAGEFALDGFGSKWRPTYRRLSYVLIALLILLFSGAKQEFIYFQF